MLIIVIAPLGVFHSRLTSLLVSLLHVDSLVDQDSSLYDILQVIIIMHPLQSQYEIGVQR